MTTDTHPEPDFDQIRIYQLNHMEWWAAMSLEEALEAACSFFDLPPEEILDELCPAHQLTEKEMWARHTWTKAGLVPFAIELECRKRNNVSFPHLFASF